jgi:hypothetical protein
VNTLRPAVVFVSILLLSGQALAEASDTTPNTINCKDWTHNADGSWTAHHDAKPFDLGTAKNIVLQDVTVHANDYQIGGTSVGMELSLKCEKPSR